MQNYKKIYHRRATVSQAHVIDEEAYLDAREVNEPLVLVCPVEAEE